MLYNKIIFKIAEHLKISPGDVYNVLGELLQGDALESVASDEFFEDNQHLIGVYDNIINAARQVFGLN